MIDPIVIDPPDFDQKAAWGECRDYVDKCGGLSHDDGSPNWRAAFGADPGICSCPICNQMYWAWGRKQRCRECGFEYPTDWWSMYSWGGQAAARGDCLENHHGGWRELWRKRWEHKYFRWAFENKAEPNIDAAHNHPWHTIFPEDAANYTGRPKQ